MSNNHSATFVKMVLDNWNTSIQRTNDLIDSLSDQDLMNEFAPGRNRGAYLLGHLTAVHDKMLTLLGFGEPLYPEMEALFLTGSDKSIFTMPYPSVLRASWKEVNERLAFHFGKMTSEQWFEKHQAVSAADFAKEPHRNKLNIVLTRTGHLQYHRGQLILLSIPIAKELI